MKKLLIVSVLLSCSITVFGQASVQRWGGTATRIIAEAVLQLNNNWLSNDGDAEGIRIDNDGNVGIGETAPSATLEIEGSGTTSSTYGLRVTDSASDSIFTVRDDNYVTVNGSFDVMTPASSNPQFIITDGDVTHPFTGVTSDVNALAKLTASSSSSGGMLFDGYTDAGSVSAIIFRGYIGHASPTAAAISFRTGKTNGATGATDIAASEVALNFKSVASDLTFMTIMGDGDVGIGTEAPSEELHVEGQIMALADVQHNTTTLAADSTNVMGAVITNVGDADGSVINLPDAVPGYKLTSVVAVAQDIDINPADTDRIMVLTDALGDAISSDATVGSYITLIAITDSTWFPIDRSGTWTDVD